MTRTGKLWKSLWHDPVWSKVIAAAVVALCTAVATYMLHLWPIIGAWSSFLVAKSAVSNWLIALLILIALPTLIVVGGLVWTFTRPSKPAIPDWESYTTDDFFGLRWRWRWSGGRINAVSAFCPTCDLQVHARRTNEFSVFDQQIVFECERCRINLGTYNESMESIKDKAIRFAEQKIRTGTWQQHTTS